ncbi:MAG: filamentous hemagglutinin family N-terminal domain-containing protein [Candidatus Kentron sp. G]|nr:MAG: filamentous hemagglutinin family N-terminal domain-containing protein [Candidatus Kentron sp. G]VFN06640.1 MAG: filamentous hemagglutinin family N-terminal domain-containing protein [Candidatus Kentron sp. G]VFN07595.1 MAG: filamentous hemagglutinin family N-terminal domain-containing protein [Candidatus Kentron sp. G]
MSISSEFLTKLGTRNDLCIQLEGFPIKRRAGAFPIKSNALEDVAMRLTHHIAPNIGLPPLLKAWAQVRMRARHSRKKSPDSPNRMTPFGIVLIGLAGSAAIQADPDPNALPTGGQVVSGAAQIHQAGSEMTIDQGTHKLIANWQTFDIGANAGVTFNQPTTSSVALNRVSSQSPSQIFGRLSANGQVMLVNPSGVVFGQGSQVNVGGITTSTLGSVDI